MKKIISALMALTLGIMMTSALSACSGETSEPPASSGSQVKEPTGSASAEEPPASSVSSAPESSSQSSAEASDAPADEGSKALVVYFSVPDNKSNSYVEINDEQLGNTQYMAYVIQENTGADIFRIVPKTPYPTDHDELLKAAQEEIRTNARPEIDGTIENFDSYDVVFVGYPNWNADLPYIMYTFFESYDFSGKTIVPFNTHGGSGFSGTQETIASLEPDAVMPEGKSISRSRIADAEQEIIDWLDSIGMLNYGK